MYTIKYASERERKKKEREKQGERERKKEKRETERAGFYVTSDEIKRVYKRQCSGVSSEIFGGGVLMGSKFNLMEKTIVG